MRLEFDYVIFMRRILTISLVLLVLLGAGCSNSNSDEQLEQIYKNQTYGFELKFPKKYEFVTPTYANLEDKIVQIQTEKEAYPNTNFGDAAVALSANFSKNLTECLKLPQIEQVNPFLNNEQINGIEFYFATSSGAAAGNFYEFKTYRALVGGQLCFEMNEVIHTTNISNYPPGTVLEFDKEPIINSLEEIVKTLKFNKN